MLHDLQQAFRNVWRTPWLAAVIVLSLAVGTGANAAVYSAVDALLFRAPAGVVEPAALVDIYTSQTNGATYGASSYPDFVSFSAGAPLDAAAALDERAEDAFRLGDATMTARIAAVSQNFWDVLGIQPYLGQWPSERQPHGAVLSFDAWQALGADQEILGRALTIGGRAYTLVAVAPPRFRGIHLDRVFAAWVLLDTNRSGRGIRRLKVIGRLAPHASLEDLQHSLNQTSHTLANEYPDTNTGTIRSAEEPRRFTALRYSRLGPDVRSQAELLAAVLLGATCLLLLSACVNAGSLLLSRGIARRTELTIKMALGADRPRLMRQLLIESLILSLSGAAAGVLIATWTAGAIPALFAPEHARLLDTRVQPLVMLLTMTAGAAAGLLCGLAPAIQSTRALSADVLRGDPAGIGDRHGGTRLRLVLVGAQLALSTIFLIESALLTKVVNTALSMRPPWAEDPLVIATIETLDPPDRYRDAAITRLQRVPSMSVAGWVAAPPLTRSARREFRIDRGSTSEWAEFDVNFATREYFAAMSIRLTEGRFFSAQDDRGTADVVMINEALAQRYFPRGAAGRSLTDRFGHAAEIIGVVRTRSYRAFEGSPQPMVYYPMSRTSARGFFAAVRARSGSVGVEQDVLGALRSAGKFRTLDVSTFDEHLSRGLAADRLVATLVGTCGVIALALAVIGVYGVMADMVRRRTREIGLRIALGAGPWQIIRTFIGVTLTPAFAGVLTGIYGAGLIVRIARSLVYGLPTIDARLAVAVVAGLSLIVVAALAPAVRRALRVSPLLAFRDRA